MENPASIFNNQKAISALSPLPAQSAEGVRNRQPVATARRDFITPDICTKYKDLGRNGTSEMLFGELHPFFFLFLTQESLLTIQATILPSYEARAQGAYSKSPPRVRALSLPVMEDPSQGVSGGLCAESPIVTFVHCPTS